MAEGSGWGERVWSPDEWLPWVTSLDSHRGNEDPVLNRAYLRNRFKTSWGMSLSGMPFQEQQYPGYFHLVPFW